MVRLTPPGGRPIDLLAVVVLLVIVGVMLGGWLLFPWLQHYVFLQDCTASGRTNC